MACPQRWRDPIYPSGRHRRCPVQDLPSTRLIMELVWIARASCTLVWSIVRHNGLV